MSILEAVTIEGASGNRYEFIVLAEDTEFNDVGAVYILTKRKSRNNYTFLYIGETESLKKCFSIHNNSQCLNSMGVNSICIHRDENQISRMMKKRDLINKRNFNAPANQLENLNGEVSAPIVCMCVYPMLNRFK